MTTNRRNFVAGSSIAAVGIGLSSPVFAQGASSRATSDAPAHAFLVAHEGEFDASARLAFLLPDGLAVVHDVPFPLDHLAYGDHLAFHAESWSGLEWIAQSVETVWHGSDHAVVSCFFNDRGKPHDAGFRQRPGFATVNCILADGAWKAVSVHFSSLRSQILAASPS